MGVHPTYFVAPNGTPLWLQGKNHDGMWSGTVEVDADVLRSSDRFPRRRKAMEKLTKEQVEAIVDDCTHKIEMALDQWANAGRAVKDVVVVLTRDTPEIMLRVTLTKVTARADLTKIIPMAKPPVLVNPAATKDTPILVIEGLESGADVHTQWMDVISRAN
jgi:hypothetical protein